MKTPKYWQQQCAKNDWCPRCQEAHDPELHFDRFMFDRPCRRSNKSVDDDSCSPAIVRNEMTNVEIAESLGCTVKSVEMLLRRAIAKIRLREDSVEELSSLLIERDRIRKDQTF